MIGKIKVIIDERLIHGIGVLIDYNHILTSSDTITPLVNSKRKVLDPQEIFFIYGEKEYEAKNIYRFQNYKLFEVLKKMKETLVLSPENLDNFYLNHVLNLVKSNITIIELKERVNCYFSKGYFDKIQNSIIGNHYNYIEENSLCLVKLISILSKDICDKQTKQIFQPLPTKEDYFIEMTSISEISCEYGYLLFDLKTYDYFCGSPLLINVNGEEQIIGFFTTSLKYNEEMFDILDYYNNKLPKCIGFKFINLFNLKKNKVLREEHLSN